MEEISSNLLENETTKDQIIKALKIADLGIDDLIKEKITIKEEEIPAFLPEEVKRKIISNGSVNLISFHKGVRLDFYNDESEGTKRMFYLMGPIIEAIENNRILVIDELDVKLHHLLNVFILELFQCSNNSLSQMIFTTHNTMLLDQDIFRRDQIWFTEKNQTDESTDLYSLLEFHPRKDADIQKGYLSGKYGAIPFIDYNELFL